MESALMSLEREPGDVEAIHAVFRAAHTIKGSAGLFGLDEIVGFTHHVETCWTACARAAWPCTATWSACCCSAATTSPADRCGRRRGRRRARPRRRRPPCWARP
jgi:chemotaxis protein histidine kinase CheA